MTVENMMMLASCVTFVKMYSFYVLCSPARLQKLIAMMEKYVWQMELPLQEQWKFASVVYGEQCVMILGMIMMLELSAGDLDLWMTVRNVFIN